MISRVEGIIAEKNDDSVIVMVGGIGLKVFTTQPCLSKCEVGKSIAFRTYMVVKEDLLALYGFLTTEEEKFFTLLLGVNGVGPKLAVSVLSNASIDTIRRAVVQEQPDILARVPGVGKKTAQKIVLYLEGKITNEENNGLAEIKSTDLEVIEALTALGYSIVQAQTAVQALPKDIDDNVEVKLRAALQSLG